jgi:competence ComEA-like helix-hairpin-helix protein
MRSSVRFTHTSQEVIMAISRIHSALVVLICLLVAGSAHAQGAKGADDSAPRSQPASKVTRPARVVATPGDATVNVNTASVKELMTLNGIGRRVAQRIVAYREAHGPFKRPDDVQKVEGVGTALWEQNRGRIAIR